MNFKSKEAAIKHFTEELGMTADEARKHVESNAKFKDLPDKEKIQVLSKGDTEKLVKAASEELKSELTDVAERVDTIDTNVMSLQDSVKEIKDGFTEISKAITKNRSELNISIGEDPEMRFNSLGEQLQAIAMAERGSMDKRLVRAPSGMGEAIPSEGGFLVQSQFLSGLIEPVHKMSMLYTECRKMTVGAAFNGVNLKVIDETSRARGSRWGAVRAYWEAENESTAGSKIKIREEDLKLKKLKGVMYATDELLQDGVALESLFTQAFAEEFAFELDDAIIRGTGADRPLGILNSPAKVGISGETGQGADTVVKANIDKMWNRMPAASRLSANWYINQDVELQFFELGMTVGSTGHPIYLPAGGYSQSPYGTLFGRPVKPIEQCSALGDEGDIIFFDPKQYIIIEKEGGMKSSSSIHVRFVQDETTFKIVWRVNGQPIPSSAITPYKGSNNRSPIVTLTSTNR